MIYCVVPRPLEEQLLDRLTEYYRDDPNVTVIVERREAGGYPPDRDRRRRRPKGAFPPIGPKP